MIHATFGGEGGSLSLNISGHSNYSSSGDIVCAAVSALAQSIGAWAEMCGECTFYTASSGRLEIQSEYTEDAAIAYELTLTGLRRIAEAYPDNLKVDVTGDAFCTRSCTLDMFGESSGEPGQDPGSDGGRSAEHIEVPGADGDTPAGRGTDIQDDRQSAGDSAEFERLISGRYRAAFEAKLRELAADRDGSPAADIVDGAPHRDHAVRFPEDELTLMRLREAFSEAAAERAKRSGLRRLARANVRSPRMIADAAEREADELRRDYPAMELAAELRDVRFRRLLLGGATVREAYEALHGDAVREAARNSERKLIRERGLRPDENGVSSAAVYAASSAAALTPSGRAELARRAIAGERISL